MRTAIITIILCGFFLIGCGPTGKPVPPISIAKELIVIAVQDTPNFYRNSDGGYSGLTVDLVDAFAHQLGLKLRFIVIQNSEEARQALVARQGHIAVGLNLSNKKQTNIVVGPTILETQHHIAYNTTKSKPKSWQALINANISVPKDSVFESQLNTVKKNIPSLAWSTKNTSSEYLLSQLAKKDIEFTVSDSFRIKRAKLFQPTIGVAFDLVKTTTNQWVYPKYSGALFEREFNQFFTRIQNDDTLIRLIDKHNSHLSQITAGDIHFFKKKIKKNLPKLQKYFHQAEALTKIDWRLIAALAYQESLWNAKAKSPTGVRGFMMLTKKTAKRMNVKDRLNTQQSILGGAQYLLWLRNKLSSEITEPDRTWMALASYNQGIGAILDARRLAHRFKLNPDYWFNLKRTLPLLNQRAYYETVKYGKARGKEAVILTESVRAYYDILKRLYHRNPQLLAISKNISPQSP